MSDCLFCKIIAGDIPSNKVYEDDLCYAFNDIAPQAPVHFLVIPKAHIASVAGVNEENSAVVAHIFEVIAKLTKEKGIESYRVVSNIGEQAGQSVFHLHFHVDTPPLYPPRENSHCKRAARRAAAFADCTAHSAAKPRLALQYDLPLLLSSAAALPAIRFPLSISFYGNVCWDDGFHQTFV